MIIPWNNLLNLPVETASGKALGIVSGVDVDADTHAVKMYRVKSRGLIKGLLNDELLVAANQVISINKERMVVNDNVVGERALNAKKIVQVARRTTPEVTSTLESSQN
jgi:uncharacterized protein YrrD